MLRGEELKRRNVETSKYRNKARTASIQPCGRGSIVRAHRNRLPSAIRYSLFAISAPALLLAGAEFNIALPGPLAALPEWAGTAWSYILLILGFSLVIFVHELGHFLAAKWAGVRVERFAIGFGKELIGFTWGETRYSFNLLPLGGYVKMLGQEDFVVDKSGELKVKADPTSFTSKSVGQRMVIISAGVIMNLIFAAIAFAIVVMVGRPQPPAVVGIVVDGSPASRAGLQTGDRILAINGEQVESFGDLSVRVTLSDPGENLVLDVMRDGKLVEPKPVVLPEFKADASVRQIGVSPGMNRRVWVPSLRVGGEPLPTELNARDELYAIVQNGEAKPCKDLGEFRRAIVMAQGAPVDIIVRRPKDPAALTVEQLLKPELEVDSTEEKVQVRATWTPIPDNPELTGTGSLLGLVPRLCVLYTDENKSFEAAGIRQGDVIVKFGSNAYPDYATIRKIIEAAPGVEIPVEVRRPNEANGPISASLVRFCSGHREQLIAAVLKDPEAAMKSAAELAAAAGLAESDRELLSRSLADAKDAAGMRRWLENVDVHKVGPLKPKSPFSLIGRSAPPPVEAGLAPLDEDHIVVSNVLDQVAGRPTPAKQAGIPIGAVIVACNEKPVRSWMELSHALRANAGKTVDLAYRLVDEIHHAKMQVPLCVTAALNIPPGSRIISIDGKTAFPIPAADGQLHDSALPDWRAIRAGFAANIGKTVNVEYVTYDGQKKSGQYAVTEANTDPWLQRIFFTEPFICYQLLERHRVANPIAAAGVGFRQAYQATMQTVQTIRHMLFTHQVGVSKVSGPVGIVRIGSRFADSGMLDLLWFLAIISANLAVINFLPMPIVDGGLFLFLILEKIRGEPVSIKTQVATQLVGIALIATLFILVTYQDIKNWITGA